jgi:hypothetical protein
MLVEPAGSGHLAIDIFTAAYADDIRFDFACGDEVRQPHPAARVEEDFEFSKDRFGLDQCQARLYTAIARHVVLVMARAWTAATGPAHDGPTNAPDSPACAHASCVFQSKQIPMGEVS